MEERGFGGLYLAIPIAIQHHFLFQNIYLFIYLKLLFIYFWLHWIFIATQGLSLVAETEG